MQYRRLGASGLLVSPICLGTMTFGTPVPDNEAVGLIHAALDLGINFIDTANVYEGYKRFLGSPGGVAEENFLDWLKLPNVASVGGSWLAPAADIRAGNWPAITARALRAVETSQAEGVRHFSPGNRA